LPEVAHNAPLHLFAADPERVRFGQGHYRPRSASSSTLLKQLLQKYAGEGLAMSYTMEDFLRDYVKEHFPKLTPAEQREALERLPPERRREVLGSLLPEERQEVLQSLPPEERREVLQSLPLEERLAGLSVEQIQQYLDQLTASRPAQPRKPRRKK
jgi:hypothetical protein